MLDRAYAFQVSDSAANVERQRAERALSHLQELPGLTSAYAAWIDKASSRGWPLEPIDIYSAYYDLLWSHTRRLLSAEDEGAAAGTFALLDVLLEDPDETVRSAVVTEVAFPLAGSGNPSMIELAHALAGPNFNAALSSQEQLVTTMTGT